MVLFYARAGRGRVPQLRYSAGSWSMLCHLAMASSSLSATVVGIAVSFIGLESLPTQYDPYTPGMNWVVRV